MRNNAQPAKGKISFANCNREINANNHTRTNTHCVTTNRQHFPKKNNSWHTEQNESTKCNSTHELCRSIAKFTKEHNRKALLTQLLLMKPKCCNEKLGL